jgi:hypothetical protein
MVQPGDQVKKGQTLAFIEQLGTHWPVEAPQVGILHPPAVPDRWRRAACRPHTALSSAAAGARAALVWRLLWGGRRGLATPRPHPWAGLPPA